ncbi:hypothetical protein [Desulfitibacter alkalitolerans]|uniref:hypothetical protein n=1 Tax=Desulfitibacter alkalitolerans TaxID=264641 RepID=UPI00047F78BA|nr:hypothetical protein [Desulfitibacter alkalitolerans]
MQKNRFKKHDKGNHPQDDQFIEGKIGSGYMSTIEGQPHLQDFVEDTKKRKKTRENKKQL